MKPHAQSVPTSNGSYRTTLRPPWNSRRFKTGVRGLGVSLPTDQARAVSGTGVSVGTVLHAYASDELERAIDCLTWPGARLHAGVHQARKSMRRVRAALALGAPALGPGGKLIDREVRHVNRSLSTLRDAQALVETLEHLAKKHDTPDANALFKRARRIAAQARIAQARASLQEDRDFAGKRAVLAVLSAGLQALPWHVVIDIEVRSSLRRSEAKARAASRKATASGRDEDWHHWRRRARRLSQQHRAVGDLMAPQDADRARDKRLAVLLGEAQDYALLLLHCNARSPFTADDRKSLRMLAKKGAKRARANIAKIAASATHQPLRLAGSGCPANAHARR